MFRTQKLSVSGERKCFSLQAKLEHSFVSEKQNLVSQHMFSMWLNGETSFSGTMFPSLARPLTNLRVSAIFWPALSSDGTYLFPVFLGKTNLIQTALFFPEVLSEFEDKAVYLLVYLLVTSLNSW